MAEAIPVFEYCRMRSDAHADVPGAPEDGAQVAEGDAVADTVDVSALLADGSRDEADAVDDGVALDAEALVRGLMTQ